MNPPVKPGKITIPPEDFMSHPEVVACLNRLKAKFGENYEKLVVSDTFDDEGHQYVDLVQKGGGVLGVALVGYTFALESAGIRFLRLAGTSAGAINTALLLVTGKKSEAKSKKVLRYVCDLNFFNLVDGHPVIRWLIRNFLTNKKFEQRVSQISLIFTSVLALLLFMDFGLLFFRGATWSATLAKICFTLTILHIALIAGVTLYTNNMLKSLKSKGYGVNPGTYFFNWIKQTMEENGVSTVTQMNAMANELPKLSVRNPATQNTHTLCGGVTFITTEIVSENKIEFPKMWDLFRENPDELHPAHFVRASMSIPLFFESHIIDGIPRDKKAIKESWENHFGPDQKIPAIARFVDGGLLSNFPINIFYNPKVIEPRMPSFGVDLDDTNTSAGKSDDGGPTTTTLTDYLGGLFNAVRYYYDKDFLIKNNVFKKGIGKIQLNEFNWLNFFVTDEEKLKMFIKGVQAGTDFLLNFDWAAYQRDRIQMQMILIENRTPEKTGGDAVLIKQGLGVGG